MLRGLPAEIRPLVERLQSRLLAETEPPSSPAADEPVPDAASIAGAARVIRESIHEAAERGAPPSRVRLLHGHLDREVGFLTRRLLEQRSAETRQVLRDVSHDIRSPLNSILFLADALISEHAGELNEVQRRQLGVLYTAAVSLVGLVNDIIDASRLGEGSEIPVTYDSFSVEAVLKEVEHLVGPLAHHRDVILGFRLETLGPRSGDRRLLTRVLINLVSNAIQVADAGGRVEVHAVEHEEGWLHLEVLDDGPGGDAPELRDMLDAETTPAPTQALRRGWTHGLGLSICARLVRATGGEISVDATPGEGCQFTIRLPFPRL
jgi:signal transduction histidine kinase